MNLRIPKTKQGDCDYCTNMSIDHNIWQDTLSKDWYIRLEAEDWDSGSSVTVKEYINFCPYCGRKLK